MLEGGTSGAADGEEDATLSDELALIQHRLGLNVSELAAALKITRPTVYAWLRGEAEPHASNLLRLSSLVAAADSLKQPFGATGRHRRGPREKAVMTELLTADNIDMVGLVNFASQQAAARTRSPKFRARDLTEKYGFPARSLEAQERSVSEETGA